MRRESLQAKILATPGSNPFLETIGWIIYESEVMLFQRKHFINVWEVLPCLFRKVYF